MRFIHVSDVHLGANPESQNNWGIDRGKEIWDSFRALIQLIKKDNIELLIISGDLFHRQPMQGEVREVNYLFSTIPNTTVVMIAGNHDYLKGNKPQYKEFKWCDNVIGLWEEEMAYGYIPHLKTYVYGLSYYDKEILAPVYDGIQPLSKKEDAIHILLAHGGDEKHIPIGSQTFMETKFDYVALGHIHKPQRVKSDNVIYPGSLEPLDKTEVGNHGYVVGDVTANTISCKFVPCAKRNYIPICIKLQGQETFLQIKDIILEKIESLGNQHMYEVTLEGSIETPLNIEFQELLSLGNILEIQDHTSLNYNLEELKEAYRGSIIERYIRYFEKKEDTSINQKALYYGLSALLEAKE